MKREKIFIPIIFTSFLFVLMGKYLWAVNPSGPPELSPAELESERMLGNLESAIMLQGNVVLIAPELEQEVQQVLSRLTLATKATSQGFRVFIFNTPLAGAWSCPNGDIMVTSGLLTIVENSDELAVVLGHELGHLNCHDGYTKLSESFSDRKAASRVSQILIGTAAGAGSSVSATLFQNVPIDGAFNKALYDQTAVRVLSDLSGRLIAYAGSEVAETILASQLSTFSQDKEFNADLLGLRYAAIAGYDAKKGSQIFIKLRELEQQKDVKNRQN